MAEEPEIVAARQYLEQVRTGRAPARDPDAAAPSAARDAAAGDPVASAFDALDARQGPFFLVSSKTGSELRDGAGERVFARVFELRADAEGAVVRAEMPDGVCRIAGERDRHGRLIAARLPDGSAVAACHLTWRAGGHIWMATDDWYRLRWNPVARGPSWKLTTGEDDEVARIRPLPDAALEIHLMTTPPDALLLLLLVAMVIRAETVPLDQVVITGGGGAG